jgi:GAF domain-containing protein
MNSLNLLKALANCSKILLENKTPNTIINKVLASIGNATNVDRAYIFKNIYEQGKLNTIKYEYEWCNIGVKPNLDNDEINNLNWSQLTDLIERLSNGRSFNSLTNEIQNPIFKETLLNQKIKSIIIKPIFVDYIFWGYIGFDECKIERIWTELELFTIKSIVSNIGIYLQRNELEIKLANKQNELIKQITFFETIFNNLPADVAVFNKDHKHLSLIQQKKNL